MGMDKITTVSRKKNLAGTAQASVGAKQSQSTRDLMNKITTNPRLPGSALEGFSRGFTGVLGQYFNKRMRDDELAQREALIKTLKGGNPFENELIAQGDKGMIGTQVNRNTAATARAENHKNAIALARIKEAQRLKIAAEKSALKAPATKVLKDAAGNESLVQWDPQTRQWTPVSPSGVGAPASAPATADVRVPDDSGMEGVVTSQQAPATAGVATPAAATETTGEPPLSPKIIETVYGKNVNLKKLGQKRAEYHAKYEALAPETKRKAENAYRKVMSSFDNVMASARNIATKLKPGDGGWDVLPESSVGFLAGLQKMLGPLAWGSEYHDVASSLNTIHSNLAFKELQTMRDNSPTGGALGQVSEKEIDFLKSAQIALAQSTSPDQFRKNLGRLMQYVSKIQSAAKMDFEKYHGKAPTEISDIPIPGQVRDGYRFKGGDPNDKNNYEAVSQ